MAKLATPLTPQKTAVVGQSATARNSIVVLAVIAAGAALYFLGSILTPFALALFLMVMIDSFARVMRARLKFLPDWAPLPLALVFAVLLFGLTGYVVAENASGFVQQLVEDKPKLNGLIARVAHLVGVAAPPDIDQLFRQLDPTKYLGSVATGLRGFASDAVLVLIYVGFLIASRRGFGKKAVRLFRDHDRRHEAQAVFTRIRDGVERYLWVQTVTGLVIAGGSWAIMAVVGLQSAPFWAFLIFIASYIPIIGGAVGIALPALFALVQFDTVWQAAVLAGVMGSIHFVVGNVVVPRMQGDSLNIDPLVVLLALAFWGAIWGVTGMFLSTPLTVVAMVVLAQFDGSRWMAVLLSGDGDPLADKSGFPPGDEDDKARPAKA